ncbi:MAG: hypothetical protein ABIA74_05960 [bacterium]
MFEEIKNNEKVIAIIVRNDYQKLGVSFFTPNDFSQQLAFMSHEKGNIIQPHFHNKISRVINFTKEVLFIKKGKLRVDFYDDKQNYLESRILNAGDVILLVSGGHGFEALQDLEMFEVKQGPFYADKDKTRFEAVEKKFINIRK